MGCSVAKTAIEKMDEIADEKSGRWTPFRDEWNGRSIWSMWTIKTVDQLSRLGCVESVMTLGSVLAVELKGDGPAGKLKIESYYKRCRKLNEIFFRKGYCSTASEHVSQKLRTGTFKNGFDGTSEHGINLICRPIGNVIYLMGSQVTTQEGIRQCEVALLDTLQKFDKNYSMFLLSYAK